MTKHEFMTSRPGDLISGHNIWMEQCQVTLTIRQRFGVQSALDYLVGEKLLHFAEKAARHPEFAAELPRFQATVCAMFSAHKPSRYLATLKPPTRNKLYNLLFR